MIINELIGKIEIVSSRYADEYHIVRDKDWFVFKLQEELGELVQKYLMMTGRARKKGQTSNKIKTDFEEEVADVLGQLLLLAKHFNINLEKRIEEKWLVWLR